MWGSQGLFNPILFAKTERDRHCHQKIRSENKFELQKILLLKEKIQIGI
jgi:hypothetical protein